MFELTEDQRDAMAHCIGHHSATGCSRDGGRNYYVAAADDPVWAPLIAEGLATARRSSLLPDSEQVYALTDAGRRTLEADPRSQRRGKAWTIRWRGHDHATVVYAETRGKAKYKAVLDVLDCFESAFDGLRRIASCRQGYWP